VKNQAVELTEDLDDALQGQHHPQTLNDVNGWVWHFKIPTKPKAIAVLPLSALIVELVPVDGHPIEFKIFEDVGDPDLRVKVYVEAEGACADVADGDRYFYAGNPDKRYFVLIANVNPSIPKTGRLKGTQF